MKKWDIRKIGESQGQYYRTVDEIYEVRGKHGIQQQERIKNHDLETESVPELETWHKLPPNPPDFPRYTTIELTRKEAEFLCGRIQFNNPKSLLASLTKHCQNGNAGDFIGDYMEIDDLKTAVLANGGFGGVRIELLSNAVMFSKVMYGVALVYNWQLAILKNDIMQKHSNNETEAAEDWGGYYEAELDKLTRHLDPDEISKMIRGQNQLHGGGSSFSWFWQLTMDQGHTITQSTPRFVENWISMLLDGTVLGGNYQSAVNWSETGRLN